MIVPRTDSETGGAAVGAPRSSRASSWCDVCGAEIPAHEHQGRPRLVCKRRACEAVLTRERQAATRRRSAALLRGVTYGPDVCPRCYYLAFRCRCNGRPRFGRER